TALNSIIPGSMSTPWRARAVSPVSSQGTGMRVVGSYTWRRLCRRVSAPRTFLDKHISQTSLSNSLRLSLSLLAGPGPVDQARLHGGGSAPGGGVVRLAPLGVSPRSGQDQAHRPG